MPRVQASSFYRGLAELRQLAIESIQEALARSLSARRPPTGRRETAGSFVHCLAHRGAGIVALYSINDARQVLVVEAIRR